MVALLQYALFRWCDAELVHFTPQGGLVHTQFGRRLHAAPVIATQSLGNVNDL